METPPLEAPEPIRVRLVVTDEAVRNRILSMRDPVTLALLDGEGRPASWLQMMMAVGLTVFLLALTLR